MSASDLIKALQTALRGGGRSLIAPPLSTASLLLLFSLLSPYRGHGSLRGRLSRRNIWSEAQALQCPQRARMQRTRPNGLPRSQPAPSPRWATLTSALPSGWISVVSLRGLDLVLLQPAERLA